MAQRVRDILLRIRGDASDAENDLHQLAREVQDFGKIQAEATVDINTAAADRKIDAAKESVKEFGRLSEEAKVDLQTRAAQTKLDRLNKQLDNLQKREPSPKVDIAIGSTVAKIERVEAQLDKLDRRRVDIDIDVDRHGRVGQLARGVTGGVSLAGRGIGSFITTISAATEAFGAFVSTVSRGFGVIGGLANLFIQAGVTGLAMVGSFVQLGVAGLVLLPILVGLAIVLGGTLISAVVALTGAMVALAASFLTAAAGVGVLATALAAAFGPVVLVAIAAMARFAKVIEAVKGRQDELAASSRRVRDANRAQAQAQQQAVDASARVRTTAVEAYRAWRDAAEEVSDAIRGIQQAELSRDQARLNVKRAEQNLRDLRKETELTGAGFDDLFKKFTDISFRPQNLINALRQSRIGQQTSGASELDIEQAILDVRQARLNEKQAIDDVGDAHTRLADARERENEFIRDGIAAYEPYTAAVEASEQAQRDLKKATEDSAKARADQNKALKDLTPTERRLVTVLGDLKKALTDLFEPATRRIFEGLIDMLKDLGEFAKDPGVRRGIRDIGTAIGDAFRAFGRLLRRKEVRDTFEDLAHAGAGVIRQFTRIFLSVFTILSRIARAALPWLEEVAGDVADAIVGVGRSATRSGIEAFVRRVRRSFERWWQIAKDLYGIVKEFFGDANDSGDKLAKKIHRILTDFKEWLHQNPDKVKQFFKDAAETASSLADSMKTIADALKWIVGAKNDIKDAFDAFTDPVSRDALEGKSPIERFWHALGFQHGGLVPGPAMGDRVPAMLEGGEYVIRKSIVAAIGVPRLNAVNAGHTAALSGGSGMIIQQQDIHLPPAPGHGQLGDPRHQAVQLARELRRRGGQGITGGGVR